MIDLSKLKYRLVAITSDGAQLDLTEITSALGWAEESKQLAAKITCKLACVPFNGKSVMELVHPFTPLFVYADMGNGFEEVIRGTVQKYELVESNGEFTLNIEAADECQALRQSQDDFFSVQIVPQPQSLRKSLVIGACRMRYKSLTPNTQRKFIVANTSAT